MSDNKPIRRVAVVGTGAIGASWAAQFLAKGLQVVATDVAPNAEGALRKFVASAWPALERLGLAPGASPTGLTFTADQVVMSRTPGSFRTVLVPRGSSKAEWLAR